MMAKDQIVITITFPFFAWNKEKNMNPAIFGDKGTNGPIDMSIPNIAG